MALEAYLVHNIALETMLFCYKMIWYTARETFAAAVKKKQQVAGDGRRHGHIYFVGIAAQCVQFAKDTRPNEDPLPPQV